MNTEQTEENPEEKWRPWVGRFVMAFGGVENVTYSALKQLPKDQIHRTAWKLGLGWRIDLVIELIPGLERTSEDLKTRFVGLLKRSKQLSDIRNKIAHSPLMLTVYEHPSEEWSFIHQLTLASIKNPEDSVSFEQLVKVTEETEFVVGELYGVYQQIYNCEIGEERA